MIPQINFSTTRKPSNTFENRFIGKITKLPSVTNGLRPSQIKGMLANTQKLIEGNITDPKSVAKALQQIHQYGIQVTKVIKLH